jgi:hypothetical protein
VAALGISPTLIKEENAISTGLVMPVISALLRHAAWQILVASEKNHHGFKHQLILSPMGYK